MDLYRSKADYRIGSSVRDLLNLCRVNSSPFNPRWLPCIPWHSVPNPLKLKLYIPFVALLDCLLIFLVPGFEEVRRLLLEGCTLLEILSKECPVLLHILIPPSLIWITASSKRTQIESNCMATFFAFVCYLNLVEQAQEVLTDLHFLANLSELFSLLRFETAFKRQTAWI
ncbi:hypothetical protein Tco_0489113 [Tanacetum coccineum]